MAELKYQTVSHDHEAFIQRAMQRKDFQEAYDGLKEEYALIREMLLARAVALPGSLQHGSPSRIKIPR
jgi:hypothetical protein